MYTVRKKEGVRNMKKKQLLKLEMIEPTEEMLELAKKDVPKKSNLYWKERDVYQYGTFFRSQIEDDILKVGIFFTDQIRAGRRLPAYILFIDKAADEFITLEVEKNRWRKSMLVNLDWPAYYYVSGKYICKDIGILNEYLKGSNGDYKDLQEYQYGVRKRQLIRRDRKYTDAWDKMMEQVPELPKDWEQWVAKTGISQHFMFYKYKKNGAKEGYCSHCRRMVPIKKPKYNREGYCSKCRHPVVYKSIGKFGRIWTKNESFYLIQKCKVGVIIRQFEASSFYNQEKYRDAEINCREIRRVFFDSYWQGKAFYYGLYKQRECRWIAVKICSSDFYYKYYSRVVYRRTLPYLEKNILSRTGLVEMLRWKKVIDPESYIAALSKNPILEKVVKAGLFRLADDLLRGKGDFTESDTGKLIKSLQIDKHRLQRLRKVQGGVQYLKWLQYEKKYGRDISDEDINWFVENHFTADDFQFIIDRMSPRQIKNYLIKQQMNSGEEPGDVLRTWKDYLSMAQRANMDVNDAIIYRASRLYQRHQELVQIIEDMDAAIKAQEIIAKYEGIDKILLEEREKYEYQDEEYAIIAPEKVEDILHEGNALHHCVDKGEYYFDRIVKRESFILFLRKAENIEKPYYTLEVEPGGTIRQKRTEYNRQLDDIKQAESFLRRWQIEIRKRMTEEDWGLADQSKELRMKELKEMRENKVIVHGGAFGGKLLADLLEEDLMEQNEVVANAA